MNDAPVPPRDSPRLSDVLVAASLLTRVPVPVDHGAAMGRVSRASWAYPVIGAALGGLVGTVAFALQQMGLSPLLSAIAAVAAGLWLTGALHEDGLADCADGFGGGHTPARRLEIMRDSRLGTFGAAALMLALMAKVALLAELGPGVAVAAAVGGAVSRVPMAWAPRLMPPARRDGLSAGVGPPPLWSASLALAVGLGIAAGLSGFGVLAIAVAVTGAAGAVGWVARRCIGGQTGDVLGAMQVLGELAALAVLTL
jgi:adenosylcobinamide-GDP ribazoletransferase